MTTGRADRAASGIELVAFDLDGVLYRGKQVIPHAREGVKAVLDRGLLVRYVTNNATLSRAAVAARLASMGFPASQEQVLGSAAATAAWLQRHVPAGALVLALGEAGLIEELSAAGFEALHVREAPAQSTAAAVVVGLDRSLTYDSLAIAQHHILEGALFVATNTDATFPAEGRVLPGGGAVVAAVATAVGREPVVIGKPGSGMAEALLVTSGVAFENMLFVGDRLDTDIAFGKRAGMRTLFVLTGVHGRDDLASFDVIPDFIFEDLAGLGDLLDSIDKHEREGGWKP